MFIMTIQKLCDKLTAFCHHGRAQEPVKVMVDGKTVDVLSVWELNGAAIISVEEGDGKPRKDKCFFDPTL